jgi:hypothetical protein
MFSEEIRRAVQAAPRSDLSRLSAVLWKAYAAGAIGEGQAQELAETIEARKALPPSAKSATDRRCGSRPRSSESLERRRRWCASGKLPPNLAARFTPAETAALSAIAAEVTKRGDCRLAIGHIAALAGICPRSVRNAIRAAEALGVLSIEERRLTAFRNDTNIIRITAPEWRAWLRLARGQGGGCKTMQRTPTDSYFPAAARPSSALQSPSSKAGADKKPHLDRLRSPGGNGRPC